MNEAAQSTQISGNVNQGYIAGRDLYLGDVSVVQETLFFEPDLADVTPPAWKTTRKAEELAGSLEASRLIVLAGQDLDNKTMVARHLAWLLCQKLPGEVRVREWYRSSDPQKIETAFHDTATTILLLPQVLPHHVGHRLDELCRLLQARRNYTVITTEGTREEWGIRSGSPEDALWHELSAEIYYGRAFLAETFLAELAEQGGRLPEWLPRTLAAESRLAEGLTVEETAVRLKQPDRIHRFVEWLATEESSPRTLLAQLDQLGGDQAAIFQWYRQLDRSDQLFALGLVLFDGLPDDQIFAAVEYLVDEAWRRTDPNLPLFDYRDLGHLSAYFHLSEAGEDGARIETPSRRKREAILQAAWELQRRRLLAVVPAMTRLIKQFSPGGAVGANEPSPPGKERRRPKKVESQEEQESQDTDDWRFTQGPDRELFSSARRVEQLQRSVVESLSRIGLLSFEAVEASFLELAAEGSVGVQTIVAKALAAWRGEGHHEKLFQVLRSWWEAGSRTTLPKSLARRAAEGAHSLAAIRATVVLAAGYAVQYDPPNELAPAILGLLEVALQDRHPAVRQRVLELTLPRAAATHPRQLEPLLRDRLLQDEEQMYAIASGVATAFSLHPLDALRILDGWHAMVRSQGPRAVGDLTITTRDRLLAGVALIYGYIRCDPGRELLTPEQIGSELQSILATETHPFVRQHALMAAGLQASENFELMAPMLMELIPEVALADRGNVVSVFVRAYLKQREQLRGGDGEIELGGRTYSTWIRSVRPLTPIEASLYSWLRDARHAVARQIAAQTLAALAATDLEQRERQLGAGEEPPAAPPPKAAVTHLAAKPRRLRRLPLLGHAAVFLAAPFGGSSRTLVRPVMAEVIEIERSHGRGVGDGSAPGAEPTPPGARFVKSVFDGWSTNNDGEVRALARSAAHAFHLFRWLFRWRWVILRGAVVLVALSAGWSEWAWSHGDPLVLEDTLALQQRRTAPLRLVRNQWVAEVRRWEEARREKAHREEELQENGEETVAQVGTNLPSGPMEWLHWSAQLELENVWVPRAERKSETIKMPVEVLLQLLREKREALVSSATGPQAGSGPGERARRRSGPSEGVAAAMSAPPPQPARESARPVALPQEESLEVAPPAALLDRAARAHEQIDRIEQQAPAPAPSLWQKLRGKLKKKKPPAGDD